MKNIRSVCRYAAGALPCLPSLYWAAGGLARAFGGGEPGFGLAALLLAGLVCLGYALGWLFYPETAVPAGPDGLLENPTQTTKALLPNTWRGELCSSIVSNQS